MQNKSPCLKLCFSFLSIFAGFSSAHADENFGAIEKQLGISMKNIVDQAYVVRKTFDTNKIKIQTIQYETLHREAFAASDQVEMYLYARNIYKELDTTKAEAMGYYLARIRDLAILHCGLSLIEFNTARDATHLPQSVFTAVNTQSANIKRACELLDSK